jgi:hypothetical protein
MTDSSWPIGQPSRDSLPSEALTSRSDCPPSVHHEAGKIRPVIDRTYPLSETGEAIRYVEQGRATGKVVITVGATRGRWRTMSRVALTK